MSVNFITVIPWVSRDSFQHLCYTILGGQIIPVVYPIPQYNKVWYNEGLLCLVNWKGMGQLVVMVYLILLSQYLPVRKSTNCSAMSYVTTKKTCSVVVLVRASESTDEDDDMYMWWSSSLPAYLLLYKAQCLSPRVGSANSGIWIGMTVLHYILELP
jgi:hypothetical protein